MVGCSAVRNWIHTRNVYPPRIATVLVERGIKAGVTFAEEDPVKRDPEPEPLADARPAPRLFAVGLAAALAVMFGGLWAVRRK